jgi:hypothetical protein
MFEFTYDDDDDLVFEDDEIEERPRCEADHAKGGVCQRLLTPSGACPGEGDHA